VQKVLGKLHSHLRLEKWEILIYEADDNITEPGEEGGNREAPGWRSVAS
jgi:hypothetical protein